MITIGVTGSIGTGKSFIASCFKRLGYPVFDADHYVHDLMQHNAHVIKAIGEQFPEALQNQTINRDKLRPLVKRNPQALKQLEAIIHPVVRKAEQRFLQKCRMLRCKIAVLDIPLLFESAADQLCDYIVVTYVNERIQRARVLKRGKMNTEFLDYIKKLQMEQAAKIEKADMVIDTARSKAYNLKRIKQLVASF